MSYQSLLWKLSPPKGQHSYLFGTMHIRDDRAYQLCHHLYPLIEECDEYFGEMDLELPETNPAVTLYDMRRHITSNAYAKMVDQIEKSFQININHYAHLHPLMIMSVISTSVLNADHMVSLDEQLWQYAREHDKPTSGLESYEDQFRILHSIDPVPLYLQLVKISRNPSVIRSQTSKSLELYMAGRIHDLYMLSKSSMQDLRKLVIYQRNKNMSSVITQLDISKKYFITVGAGHLSGKFGLLPLLKQAGWKTIPLKLDNP
ncbi:MAG: TraB/GumN family protein [Saprospiraceae bacterium]